ncbi:MAG: putative Ig domain-containing protein, partial [Fibromonadales bacterium]|nr:putative Ig domain-containing protein [Fibromonadales bacterium]
KVTNSVGFDSKEFTITIADEYLPPEISEYEIYEGETGDKYEGYIYSDRAASWSVVAGSLPPGLEFESVFSRVLHISGVPTTPGEYTFTVRATNSVGFDEKSFTIKITGEALPPDLAAECLAAGKVWENDQCTIPTVTILPQFAASKIRAYAAGKTIVLENVPAGAKAEVYNIQGKRIYSANPDNPLILKIGVQTGVYIVRVSFGSEKQILRVPVR